MAERTETRLCVQCGKPFQARLSAIKVGNGRFCGMRCVYDQMASEPLESRLLRNVTKTETCWLWTGALAAFGYGTVNSKGRRSIRAHRLSWEIYRGEIPAGLCVLHKCDVPACVNPDHLFLGTKSDNMRDCAVKGRLGQQLDPAKFKAANRRRSPFTEDVIRLIRSSPESHTALGKHYGVTKGAIWRIRKGLNWKDVA